MATFIPSGPVTHEQLGHGGGVTEPPVPGGGDRCRIGRGFHPVRHRPRQPFDVGGQRRVVADVIGRMLADDVDDARMRLLGVVQIGEPVGEPGAEMQQRRGRRALHAEIAVGRTRHHAFEQPEHAAHALDPIERGDKMHLGSAGIGEADVHAARDQGPHQTFRTVHRSTPVRGLYVLQINHCSRLSSKGARTLLLHMGKQSFWESRAFLTAAFEIATLTAAWLAKLRPIWPDLADPIFSQGGKNDPGFGSAGCGTSVLGRQRPFARPGLRHARHHGRRPEFL